MNVLLRGLADFDHAGFAAALDKPDHRDLVRATTFGYRVLLIDSSTYEEAIPTLPGWIRQRSRWLKGYMQTGFVHLREPRSVLQGLGLGPFCGFAIFVAGAALTTLLAPLFWLLSLVMAWMGSEAVLGPVGILAIDISAVSLIAGNGVLTLLAILAPLKRRWPHLMPYGATVFFYWLLMSLAAYKALWQLARRPFYWEKSQHGVAAKAKRG